MPKLCAVQIFALHSRCNQGISYFRANAQLCPLWAAADCSNLIRRRQSSIALSVYSLARVFSSGSPRVSRSSRSRGCVSAFQAALTTGSLEFHGGVANRWRTLSPSLTAEQARDRSFHNCWILCIGGVLAVGVSAGRTPRSAGWPLGHLVACVVYFAVHIGKVRGLFLLFISERCVFRRLPSSLTAGFRAVGSGSPIAADSGGLTATCGIRNIGRARVGNQDDGYRMSPSRNWMVPHDGKHPVSGYIDKGPGHWMVPADQEQRPRQSVHQRRLDQARSRGGRSCQHGWKGTLDRQCPHRKALAQCQV